MPCIRKTFVLMRRRKLTRTSGPLAQNDAIGTWNVLEEKEEEEKDRAEKSSPSAHI